MSTRLAANLRVTAGDLIRYVPALSGMPAVRTLYLSPAVDDLVGGRVPELEARGGELMANLDSFVQGQRLVVSLRPHKAGNAYMGLLGPESYGIWDIRSRDPRPALRVFGGFLEKDVFVGLTWRVRLQLEARNSAQWEHAISECRSRWTTLVPEHLPITGERVSDYFTTDVIGTGDL